VIYPIYLLMRIDKITSIRVHESTKDYLAQQGSKGESYEDIILRLIEKLQELMWGDDL
jgi:hypothetical protein